MKKILIIDDNIDDVISMKEILEKENYDIKIATNGKKAIKLINEQNFDCFLVDIRLPDISGYEISNKLKEKQGNTKKIIFVTILPKQEVKIEKAKGFIQKPFTINKFLTEVKKITTA